MMLKRCFLELTNHAHESMDAVFSFHGIKHLTFIDDFDFVVRLVALMVFEEDETDAVEL